MKALNGLITMTFGAHPSGKLVFPPAKGVRLVGVILSNLEPIQAPLAVAAGLLGLQAEASSKPGSPVRSHAFDAEDDMLSQHWPALDRNAFKVLVFLVGAIAAWTARRAARLWQKASDVQIEDTTPRTQVSWGDVPELGVLEAIVAVNAVKAAYDASAVLNANAAKQTAVSAALTGLATVLGVL